MALHGNPDDLLWTAAAAALQPLAHLETDWEVSKLVKRIRDYFRKAAKGLEFGTKSWQELVLDLSHCAYGSIFQALGDREWTHQADFVLVLDATVRETFPRRVLEGVAQAPFERVVLAAHDQAFEEQRYLPLLWQQVQSRVDHTWAQKRVYEAASIGRKVAMSHAYRAGEDSNNVKGVTEVKDFVSRWIDVTVNHLAKHTQGDVCAALPDTDAASFFRALIDHTWALPVVLTTQHGAPPRDWPFLDYAVRVAYAAHANPNAPMKRPKARGGGGRGLGDVTKGGAGEAAGRRGGRKKEVSVKDALRAASKLVKVEKREEEDEAEEDCCEVEPDRHTDDELETKKEAKSWEDEEDAFDDDLPGLVKRWEDDDDEYGHDLGEVEAAAPQQLPKRPRHCGDTLGA